MNDGLTKFVHLQSKAKVSSEKNELSLKEFLTTVEECRDLHLEFFFFAVGRNFFHHLSKYYRGANFPS